MNKSYTKFIIRFKFEKLHFYAIESLPTVCHKFPKGLWRICQIPHTPNKKKNKNKIIYWGHKNTAPNIIAVIGLCEFYVNLLQSISKLILTQCKMQISHIQNKDKSVNWMALKCISINTPPHQHYFGAKIIISFLKLFFWCDSSLSDTMPLLLYWFIKKYCILLKLLLVPSYRMCNS